jgi:uncharacterized protein YndB with AHSA1/START domain
MTATKTITVEYDLPHAPAKVWRVLTEPKLLENWLMPNDIAPVPGHKFTFKTKPMGEWDGIIHCEVLSVEPNKRLAYSWVGGSDKNQGWGEKLDTVVTWTLTEKPGGTLLLLEHSGFRERDEFAYSQMGKGWKSHGGMRMKAALDAMD